MKKIALHWKILIGMGLGVVFGLLLSFVPHGAQFIKSGQKKFKGQRRYFNIPSMEMIQILM